MWRPVQDELALVFVEEDKSRANDRKCKEEKDA